MQKHIRWLRQEMEGWIKDGIITSDQVQTLQQRYPEPKALPWVTIIFSGLGSIILGLGVILLFAYNWDVIPRLVKLGVILAALIGTHIAALRLFWKSEHYSSVGEALSILGTMFFGGGIWLVAQVYHLDEHYPTAFLIWGLGALALAWALPSMGQAIIAAILFMIWVGSESFSFSNPPHMGLVFLASILCLAWQLRSSFLLRFGLLVFLISFSMIMGHLNTGFFIWIGCSICLSVFFVALSRILEGCVNFPKASGGFLSYGWLLGCVTIFILTFEGDRSWEYELHRSWFTYDHWSHLFYPLLFTTGAIIASAYAVHLIRNKKRSWTITDTLLPLTAFLVMGQTFLPNFFNGPIVTVAYNLVFLALAVSTMAYGCKEGLIKPTLIGALLLIALTIARYTDLFESLLARSAMFLLVGGIIFAEGLFYTRLRKQKGGTH